MAQQISQRELRNDSGEIFRRVGSGESFVVTSNGAPVAELTPLHRQRFMKAEAVLALFRDAPRVDYGLFREDLDRYLDQDITPRA
jgi:prevent-host-death family protein